MQILFYILFILALILPMNISAQSYPEFAGNYIECGGKWCTVQGYFLDKMTLANLERNWAAHTTYPGFLKLPTEIFETNSRRPRILLYSGKVSANIEATALLELEPMPFNNRKIDAINTTNYQRKIVYSNEHVKSRFWVMKREILLNKKPIKGEISMFLYEPVEPLTDGLYAIDSGIISAGGHKALRLSPIEMGLYTHEIKTGVLPFIIGTKDALIKANEQNTKQK